MITFSTNPPALEPILLPSAVGDSGSPVFAHTDYGRVIIAVFASKSYNCTPEGHKLTQGVQYLVRVSEAMPWIITTIVKHTLCHCIEMLWKRWAAIIEGKIEFGDY